jgi:predicted PurR-regulated permease PerM
MQTERGPFLSNPFVARAARWGLLAWSVIGVLVLAWVVFRYVLYPIRIVFPPLVVALIVIYLLNPIVTYLQSRGVRRGLGTLVVYVVVLSLAGVALAYLIGGVAHQVTQFVAGIPRLLVRAQNGLGTISQRLGLHLDSKTVVKQFERGGGISQFVGRVTSFTSGVVHVAFVLVLGPLIAFYLLVDLPRLQRGAEALVPASRREDVAGLASEVNATLGGFFRGQLLVALAMGLVSMCLFLLIGLPYYAFLGAITGLFGLVPLIGTVIAAVPALFVALTSPHRTGGLLHVPGGWKLAVATVVVLVAVQQLDVRLLSPWMLSRTSRLNPVTVLLSLLVGGTLLGLWGMLLAVPVVAAAKVVVLYVWDTRATWPPQPSEDAALTAPPSQPPPPPPDGAEAGVRTRAVRSVPSPGSRAPSQQPQAR